MRPQLIVASPSPYMADALALRLRAEAGKLDVRVRVAPGGTQSAPGTTTRAYASADELFEFLDGLPISAAADTQVWLDLSCFGEAKSAFAARGSSARRGWHALGAAAVRPAVGLELLLRHPLVYPVFIHFGATEKLAESIAGKFAYPGEPNPPASVPKLATTWANTHLVQVGPESDEKRKDGNQAFIHPLQLFAYGARCHYNPSGLRTAAKRYLLGNTFGKKEDWEVVKGAAEQFKKRMDRLCFVVDDDPQFAAFAAHAAWRKGYCTLPVTSNRLLESLKESYLLPATSENFRRTVFVLRDYDLRFPDFEDESSRREKLKLDVNLREAMGLDDKVTMKTVTMFPEKACRAAGKPAPVKKPLRFLHDLLRDIPIPNDGEEKSVTSFVSTLAPAKEGGGGGHGAPYWNLLAAVDLLARCRTPPVGAVDALRQSLLAHEAYELVLCAAPITALEAAHLLHVSELRGEVLYEGVSSHLDMVARADEFEQHLGKLLSFGQSSSTRAHAGNGVTGINRDRALARFWGEARALLRHAEEFSAAEQANRLTLTYLMHDWFERLPIVDKIADWLADRRKYPHWHPAVCSVAKGAALLLFIALFAVLTGNPRTTVVAGLPFALFAYVTWAVYHLCHSCRDTGNLALRPCGSALRSAVVKFIHNLFLPSVLTIRGWVVAYIGALLLSAGATFGLFFALDSPHAVAGPNRGVHSRPAYRRLVVRGICSDKASKCILSDLQDTVDKKWATGGTSLGLGYYVPVYWRVFAQVSLSSLSMSSAGCILPLNDCGADGTGRAWWGLSLLLLLQYAFALVALGISVSIVFRKLTRT